MSNYDLNRPADCTRLVSSLTLDPDAAGTIARMDDQRTLHFLAHQPELPVVLLLAIPANPNAGEVASHMAWVTAVRGQQNYENQRYAMNALAYSPFTNPRLLDECVRSQLSALSNGGPNDANLRFLTDAAGNNRAAPETLEALSRAPDFHLRRVVASNVATPLSVLSFLANDMEMGVRRNVAANPSAGLAALRYLTGDVLMVRAAVAQNSAALVRIGPDAKALILPRLLADDNRLVSTQAAARIAEIETLQVVSSTDQSRGQDEQPQRLESGLPSQGRSEKPIDLISDETVTREKIFKHRQGVFMDAINKIADTKRPDVLYELSYAFFLGAHEFMMGISRTKEFEKITRKLTERFPKETAKARATLAALGQGTDTEGALAIADVSAAEDSDLPTVPALLEAGCNDADLPSVSGPDRKPPSI